MGIIEHFYISKHWSVEDCDNLAAFGNSTSSLCLMPIYKGRFPLPVKLQILKRAISVRIKLGFGCKKGLTQNMRFFSWTVHLNSAFKYRAFKKGKDTFMSCVSEKKKSREEGNNCFKQ